MLCFRCESQLKAALVSIFTYHGLAYDLDLAISKQTQFGERHGARSTETPVLFDEHASDAAHELKNTLVTWARIVHQETGAELPKDTTPAIANWLFEHIAWIRHHEDAEEAHGELLAAVRTVRIVIDRPLEKIYVGPCECGTHLFARLGARYVTCPNVEAHEGGISTWRIGELVEWLLAQAEDVAAPAAQISAALTHYDRPVTPAAIRGYVRRKKLRPCWCTDPDNERRGGAALYRLGDVLDAIAPPAEAAIAPPMKMAIAA